VNEVLKQFRCRHPSGECLMGLHVGLGEEYALEGTKVLFRGADIGDLSERTLEEIICGDHCSTRFFDEVLGAPDTRQRFRVVKKYSIPRNTNEEDDF
jgi:hypothetical protein